MRRFSFGPSLAIKGRKFKGLRGYAGKPFHPPLTDVPITAYMFGAVFDVLSLLLHSDHEELATELFRAGTWVFVGGAAVSVLAALTGWADWHRSSEPGTQARRTINALLVSLGATLGGSLVYDYGFNVETAGDHPVWHQNEVDVLPGQK